MKPVPRMERSGIRDSCSAPRSFPDYASLHPGYITASFSRREKFETELPSVLQRVVKRKPVSPEGSSSRIYGGLTPGYIVLVTNEPYARNTELGIGFLGSGGVTNIQYSRNKRDFIPDERVWVHTIFQTDLPFCLHGIQGNWEISDIAGVRVFTHTVPREVAQFTTGFDEIVAPNFYLCPDNWGKVNYSMLLLVFYKFLPILLNQSDGGDSGFDTQDRLDEYNHDLVCQQINPMIDKYCLATKNYSNRRVAPNDFLSFSTWQDFKGEDHKYNFRRVFFRSANAALVPPPPEVSPKITSEMKKIAKYSPFHKAILSLLLDANREAELKNYILAAIQAAMALEAILENFISNRVEVLRTRQDKKLLTKKSVDNTSRSRNLATNLNVILPLMLLPCEEISDETIKGCDEIRKQKNYAVHQNIRKFSEKAVMENLIHVSTLINWIVDCKDISDTEALDTNHS
ncbi:MAG: hypothetical protein AB7P69_24920 [Candidatus Binatia bacterium]